MLPDPGRLVLSGGQVGLPAGLHRLDQPAADSDHEDASDGGEHGDQHGCGDGGGDTYLVQRRDDAQSEDEDRGNVGQGLAVGQSAQASLDEGLDSGGDRGGDHDDDDRDNQRGNERDDRGQQVTDRVGPKDSERKLQHEQHQRVVDELADNVRCVVFGLGQGLSDPATLHGAIETDPLEDLVDGLGDGLGDEPANQQNQ